MGMWDYKKQPAGKLSKGQKQRLVLAKAVLHKPRILLLNGRERLNERQPPCSGTGRGRLPHFTAVTEDLSKDFPES